MIIKKDKRKFFYADIDAEFCPQEKTYWIFYDNYEAEDIEIYCGYNIRLHDWKNHESLLYWFYRIKYCEVEINDNRRT